ncbi:glycosyltransferase family 2 protein [Candidatus Omnitrophota bacterium]
MISIIIVNYNRRDLLKRCLDSVRGQGFKDLEIIVVDNASSDDSVEMVNAYYPEVRLISNTRNLFFCKAYNQGIDESKGNFILCLNNDIILDKDYLKEALSAISSDTKIGMISGKVFRMDTKMIDSTGLFLGKNRKAIERGYGKRDGRQYEKPEYIFGVSGACAFFRKSMLIDVKDKNGYFDESFAMYYEDLDLCWRAQKRGWKAYYNPKATAYHVRAGTAVVRNGRKGPNFIYLPRDFKKMYIGNRYKCIRKNDTFLGVLVNLPFILLYEIKVWGYLALNSIFNFARTLFFRQKSLT